MKVITEKRLRELSENCSPLFQRAFKWLLHVECQELDTLTVTRLRPMSEAPEIQVNKFCAYALVQFEHISTFQIRRFELYKGWTDTDLHLALGWIPMPRYEPENI